VGATEEVLVDGPSKKDPAVLSGRTRQNKLVHFADPAGSVRPGGYAEVRVTSAAPHFLRGDLVRVTDPGPARRVRIPVAAG
jgi:tRNA-2-methylthio-N6-dimethylallyladenosine synthase